MEEIKTSFFECSQDWDWRPIHRIHTNFCVCVHSVCTPYVGQQFASFCLFYSCFLSADGICWLSLFLWCWIPPHPPYVVVVYICVDDQSRIATFLENEDENIRPAARATFLSLSAVSVIVTYVDAGSFMGGSEICIQHHRTTWLSSCSWFILRMRAHKIVTQQAVTGVTRTNISAFTPAVLQSIWMIFFLFIQRIFHF